MRALRRAADRRARRLGTASGVSGPMAAFSGAIHNRLTSDWIFAGIQSADQEVRHNLKVLKSRSRELARNNPHAKRFLDIKADNLIGEEGIQLQAHVRDRNGKHVKSVNQKLEDGWKEFCEVGVLTADGRQAMVEVERLVVEEEARDGDMFVRMLPAWRQNRFGFALQCLDSDQIDLEHNEPGGRDAQGQWHNEVRMGIEVNEWNRPMRYHVWGNHPSEAGRREDRRTPIPASQMVHFYRSYRTGQTRGVPDFAPVLLVMKMLAGYEEAELVASRIAAAKGGFFERTPESAGLGLLPEDSEKSPFTLEVEPGLFESLPPGWKFTGWDPKHPSSAFPDFHKAMLRMIATGLGVSYHVLSQDLEGVSFSSIRQGMLSERDTWKVGQSIIWRHFHTQVYREWLRWALTTGALDLPTRNPRDYYDVRWQPRGWDWVDPDKDLSAAAKEVRMGVNSRTRIAASRGRNFEDVVEELAYEQEVARAAGVDLTTDMSRGGGSDTGGDGDDQAHHELPIQSERLRGLLRGGAWARTGRGRLILNGDGG